MSLALPAVVLKVTTASNGNRTVIRVSDRPLTLVVQGACHAVDFPTWDKPLRTEHMRTVQERTVSDCAETHMKSTENCAETQQKSARDKIGMDDVRLQRDEPIRVPFHNAGHSISGGLPDAVRGMMDVDKLRKLSVVIGSVDATSRPPPLEDILPESEAFKWTSVQTRSWRKQVRKPPYKEPDLQQPTNLYEPSEKGNVDSEKAAVAEGPPAFAENSPVISNPVLVSYQSSAIISKLVADNPSSLRDDGSHRPPTTEGAEKQGISGTGAEIDPEKVREEQAAIKAQAAFRGFLARRAFLAVRGAIRLQALVRGRLVRRQAIVTLHSMLAIIKLQALARGQKVAKGIDFNRNKLYASTLVCKHLSSSLVVMPLQIQYHQEEPNSVANWMDRWTFSHFWKPSSKPPEIFNSIFQTKRSTYAMENESDSAEQSVKRNSSVNVDPSKSNISTEPEKTKCSERKVSSSTDTVPEHPQSELENVKRNLRKVSNMAETSDISETEADNQPHNMEKMADLLSQAPHQSIDDSAKNAKKSVALAPEVKPDMEIASKALVAERSADGLADDHPPDEPLQSINEDENFSSLNRELSLEEGTFEKTSKRAPFSAMSNNTENGVQNTPTLQSYMQANQSAEAKLQGQDLPTFGADSTEKNVITRQHSLPWKVDFGFTSRTKNSSSNW